jgi:putative transposase
LKKSGSVLREGAAVSQKYAFVAAERAEANATAVADAPTIAQRCAWLGVSTSGFYDWLHRPPSPAQQRRDLLKMKIAALVEACGGVYGYRRIHAALRRAGEQVGSALSGH